MDIINTPIEGLLQIKASKYPDERGWFREFYNPRAFDSLKAFPTFVQDNLSFSKKGVIRGLHMQTGRFGQAKLVSVLQGRVLDVVVDVRPASHTFGRVYTLILSGDEQNSLFVPQGFAHGFSALEDSLFMYKCSSFYEPSAETGIRWNDPDLEIDWQVDHPIISPKDQQLPTFADLKGKLLISPHA
jgi:dTDP-4-dehydrorhamnose 3,5-epimerase